MASELDGDEWLLNVQNGTLDLRSGILAPHDRSNLLTRISPVDYVPGAAFPRWDGLLQQVTGGDAEFQQFLQRVIGYGLTASTREECLFLIYGPGASGKTTFVEAVKTVLGDYALTADFESFIKRRSGGGIRNDLARLHGARFVSGSEVSRGESFDAKLVKQFTGGDRITARFR